MAARTRHKPTSKEIADLSNHLDMDGEELGELLSAGFTPPDMTPRHRLIVSSSAREKCGKSHFSLATTPEPIAFINLDLGLEGVALKFADRQIIQRTFTLRQEREAAGEKFSMADAEKEWDAAREAINAVVRCPVIKTLVVDTATDLWELVRLSHFGKLDKVLPHHYGAPNMEFRSLIQSVYRRTDLNVLFIHKTKKEYKDDKWKGRYARAGFSDMSYLVQANIEHYKLKGDEPGEPPTFGIRVVDCRQNPDMDGEELEGPLCSFLQLAMMVFPDSSIEDWR